MEEQFVISELAKRTGYGPGMIRHFERVGVISPAIRSAAGYRLFGPPHVKELNFVREMQDFGFYAQQIKHLREIKLSDLPIPAKKEAIGRVFEVHNEYVDEKAAYFTNLLRQLREAASTFVDRVMESDC